MTQPGNRLAEFRQTAESLCQEALLQGQLARDLAQESQALRNTARQLTDDAKKIRGQAKAQAAEGQ